MTIKVVCSRCKVFLEDVGEDIQHIHRYLTVLKHTGVLDNAFGVVFGEWTELPVDHDRFTFALGAEVINFQPVGGR